MTLVSSLKNKGAGAVAEYERLLEKHFLLMHLDAEDLRQLGRKATVSRYTMGSVIFRQGDPVTDLMIILKGRVKLGATSGSGKELTADFRGPGEMFGEIAVIDGKPRTYNATALEISEVLVLQRRDLMPLLETKPHVCLKFMFALCERLRHSEGFTLDTVFLHIGARLARQLLQLAKVSGRHTDGSVVIERSVSQIDLANLVGMTRESVNKQLCRWRRDGVIWFKGRLFIILKLDVIEEIAGSRLDGHKGQVSSGQRQRGVAANAKKNRD